MKINKLNTYIVVLLMGIFISSTAVFAQEGGEDSLASQFDLIRQEIQEQGQPVSGLDIAYLEAQSLNLTDSVYRPGDTVEGSVVVRNGGSIAAERILPAISLVGNFDGFIPTAEYDIDNSQESFSLVPGEKKTLYFSYKLPEVFLSSDLGIKVEFHTDTGLRQDSIVQPFSARGDINATEITQAALVLRDRQYGLRSTPTVYPENELALEVAISTAVAKTFTPTISIYDFSSVTGDLVASTENETQTLAVGDSVITLPVTSGIPDGMFEAVVEFKDDTGTKVVPDVLFLFMRVSGDMSPFRLRNITVADSISNQEIKNFRVSYTGGAPDIDIFLDNPNQTADLDDANLGGDILPDTPPGYEGLGVVIDVYQNDNRLAGGSVDATLAEDFVITIPVEMRGVASGTYLVKASVVETETGKVREEYSKEMFINGVDEGDGASLNISSGHFIAIGVGLVLLVIIGLLMLARRKGQSVPVTNTK